jgi:hypothetical protein
VLTPGRNLFIPDLAKDWRYAGNPYVDSDKGVKSYLGSVISLNVDPSSSTEQRAVGIGVINSMHLDDYLPPLNEEQERVMKHVSRMLETQLRASWEGQGRTREARARRAVSDFVEMIGETKDGDVDPYSLAVKQIRAGLKAVDGVGVVDLRSIHGVVSLVS